jgi:hypothetical protein
MSECQALFGCYDPVVIAWLKLVALCLACAAIGLCARGLA